jgi:DNA-binding LacI/PurR family transcriptional regulator
VTVAYHDPEVGCPAVVADNTRGVREVVRHLIAHGHRRIAFIGWLGYPAIAERYEGYRDALTESGLSCSPELTIAVADNHVASGRAGARQLLEGGALPRTAVVAGTDRNAVGAMEVFQAAGLRVPEDVAVVGFDDLTDASLADPPLTTTPMAATPPSVRTTWPCGGPSWPGRSSGTPSRPSSPSLPMKAGNGPSKRCTEARPRWPRPSG